MTLKKTGKELMIVLFITLFLLEIALRIWGKYETYNERASNKYQSLFHQNMGSWYFLEKPFSTITDERSEFQHRHSVDSLGCNWYNTPSPQDTSSIKILVLGDSFTFGIGAPQDSCWPKLLADMFKGECSRNIQIINGSRQASDPFFSYMVYRDILKDLHPDLVLLSLNSTDILEVYSRGGWERFKPDSTTITKNSPWFEPFYHYSHAIRAVLALSNGVDNEYLYNKNHYNSLAINACKPLFDCLQLFHKEVAKNNSHLLVLNFPLTRELKEGVPNQYNAYAPDIVRQPYVNSDLDSSLRGYFKTHDIKNYYWPLDGHFNGDGYKVMAEKIHEMLLSKNEVVFNSCGKQAQ